MERARDFFGFSVSLSGGLAAISGHGDSDAGVRFGAAYVFQVGRWMELQKITASDGVAGDQFGRSLSLSGRTLLVGSHLDDTGGSNTGAAYVYDLSAGRP